MNTSFLASNIATLSQQVKPRLLVFTQWFAPGFRAGGPIRSTTNLVALLQSRFDIRVITSDRDLGCDAPYPGVVADEWLPHGPTAHVMYVSPRKQSLGDVRSIITDTAPDCIYLNSMFSPLFTLAPLWWRWRGQRAAKMVVAPRGELLAGAMQFKRLKKTALLRALRASGIARTLDFHATDDQERAAIIRLVGADPDRVRVILNVPEQPATVAAATEKTSGHARLLFLSRVAPKKNLVFLLDTLRDIPDGVSIHLTIAGPVEDAGYWQRCREAIAALPKHVTATAIGPVEHHRVRELIAEHHCFVLPTFGENYGHGIIEALGTGRPVIISDQTPWRRLHDHGAGWDLPLTEPTAFTRAITRIAAMEQGEYDKMADAALALARRTTHHTTLVDSYSALFSGC